MGRAGCVVVAWTRLGLLASCLGGLPAPWVARAADPRPNILLVLVDDMGWSDLGCYGGEVRTPNVDRLAKAGLRFSAFYNTGRCCPTRASLLTGLYPHQAGVGQMTFDRGHPGYRGQLSRNAVTIAEALRTGGYRTAMVGKWHLSLTAERPGHMRHLNNQEIRDTFADPETYPVARGFEEHYGVIWGVVNFFDPFSLVHNRKAIASVPEDYYITDAFSDQAIKYIDEFARGDEPFFLYLAHCAPHWPLHALPKDIERYRQTYSAGWAKIRQDRYRRQLEMGLLNSGTTPLSERYRPDQPWSANATREWDAGAMACHAAMIDRVDQGMGRIIARLEQLGQLDNTLIFFLSDNGASREEPGGPGFDRVSHTRDGRRVTYYGRGKPKEQLPGGQTTYAGIGPAWANASNTPFRLFKATQFEGGIRTPLVVHWPKGLQAAPGSITRQVGHVIDILPTCLDVAGVAYPKQFQGRPIRPAEGKSLRPILEGADRNGHEAIYFEHFGARAVRSGDWKLVAPKGVKWELYRITQDESETKNLADRHPEQVKRLSMLWDRWAARAQVVPGPGRPAPDRKPVAPSSVDRLEFVLRSGDELPRDRAPQIANRPISVRATITRGKNDGVIIAHGGDVAGFALYVDKGRLRFATRVESQMTIVAADQPLPAGRVRVGGDLAADGELRLFVSDKQVAAVPSPGLIPVLPIDGLKVGTDSSGRVGPYGERNRFEGKIHEVRISLGKIEEGAAEAGKLVTRWAADVKPENVHPEYPRPQMVRQGWTNLNGLWDYAIVPRQQGQPQDWTGTILVPFPVESKLSRVQKPVGEARRLWYRRTFARPTAAAGGRVLLHFGAVDWQATVWVNGVKVGEHRGGYDPFTFDVTDALNSGGDQELVVAVWDPTDGGTQPRGKQYNDPKGIWYTPVTGIWQTVWLETVPAGHIRSLKMTPMAGGDKDHVEVRVARAAGASPATVRIVVLDGETQVARIEGQHQTQDEAVFRIRVPAPKLWSPDSPHLYGLEISLHRDGRELDRVTSYFAMRSVRIGRDDRGFNMLMLNGKPLFQFGPLDQGWWPDGLYTAPTDEALRYDIEITKQLGFNMIRKHVKVEPARWYHHCDRLGLLVWQDMPSGMDDHGGPQHVQAGAKEDAIMPPGHKRQFEAELKEMIDDFGFFPSIVMWVPFNEGWGQYDTKRVTSWVEQYDPTRLVNATSGWTDRGVGDVYDCHLYPGPGIEYPGPERAAVLGEFGGLGWPVEGHLWWNKRNWGYRTYKTREELSRNYHQVVGNVYGLLGHGLAAAVYTQTTDVEGEVNGLMTYDRAVLKFDVKQLRQLHDRLYERPPIARVLVAASRRTPQSWRYTTKLPGKGWQANDFAAANWEQGSAPFQSGQLAMLDTGTLWKGSDIWLRREFNLDEVGGELGANIFHEVGEAKIFLNGQLILDLSGTRPTRRHYQFIDLAEHSKLLRRGPNVLAAHGLKRGARKALDLGLYVVTERGAGTRGAE